MRNKGRVLEDKEGKYEACETGRDGERRETEKYVEGK
jgi:hypothetical protein